jgi:hypothetical protein
MKFRDENRTTTVVQTTRKGQPGQDSQNRIAFQDKAEHDTE